MKKSFIINGMNCHSCKILIEDVCGNVPGVESIDVDYVSGRVELEHNQYLDLSKLRLEIEDLGDYRVEKL